MIQVGLVLGFALGYFSTLGYYFGVKSEPLSVSAIEAVELSEVDQIPEVEGLSVSVQDEEELQINLPQTEDSSQTASPTDSPAPTSTATPTLKPTVSPTPPPTIEPIETPSPSPTPSPTIEPIKTPEPSPTSTPDVWSPDSMKQWFSGYAGQYGVDENVLERIANCESHFNPNAANGPYLGMFQFSASTWSSVRQRMGEDANPELRTNAEEAIQTAAYMISTSGTSAWPSCL